jgi:hypothetical protein
LEKDSNGNPFIASSCQLGASVWWPNKDHMYDEVSMLISVNVPGNLINVSNGRLISVKKGRNKTFNWYV